MKALSEPESGAPRGDDHLGRAVFHRLVHALRLWPIIALAAIAPPGPRG